YIAAVLASFVPHGPILLAGDDTVTEHPGPHVYGKGRHRDPVRSTHTYTAFRWGHKWVVLALLVPVPWATRRWALPLLIALYRTKEDNAK
ncbi:transposase, partial [Singulisphaera acidiphila]|uniref:transposase n=1 Tax=Singulisphaera acidiphila TaxID=466153 RepID=UPI000368CCC8